MNWFESIAARVKIAHHFLRLQQWFQMSSKCVREWERIKQFAVLDRFWFDTSVKKERKRVEVCLNLFYSWVKLGKQKLVIMNFLSQCCSDAESYNDADNKINQNQTWLLLFFTMKNIYMYFQIMHICPALLDEGGT